MRLLATMILFFLIGVFTSVAQPPQPFNSKYSLVICEELVRQRLTPGQAQYTNELAGLAKTIQAKGELENLLAIKKEQERSTATLRIQADDIVHTPVELRNLQLKYQAWQGKTCQQAAREFLTVMEEQKKNLTIQGRLEEALEVKSAIEKIQQQYNIPISLDSSAPKTEMAGYSADSSKTDTVTIVGKVNRAAFGAMEAAAVQVGKVTYRIVKDAKGKVVARDADNKKVEIKGTLTERNGVKWITVSWCALVEWEPFLQGGKVFEKLSRMKVAVHQRT